MFNNILKVEQLTEKRSTGRFFLSHGLEEEEEGHVTQWSMMVFKVNKVTIRSIPTLKLKVSKIMTKIW